MATKAELVAYASDVGVDVSESWTKADIEAALRDAGYDPTILESPSMTDEYQTPEDAEAYAEEIEGTSSDAANSTYTEADVDTSEMRPAPGRLVEQTRGEPAEAE